MCKVLRQEAPGHGKSQEIVWAEVSTVHAGPLRGLARVYSISPGAKCVSDFLTVVTKCQAGTREEDLCGFWLEGIPSVMAGEAWWQAAEGQQPAAACYRAPKQEAESWAGCDSQCTSFSPPPLLLNVPQIP